MTQTLLDLERRGWDALCDGTASAFYGALMTDDVVCAMTSVYVAADEGWRLALHTQTPVAASP